MPPLKKPPSPTAAFHATEPSLAPSISVTMRWAVSGEVLGTVNFRLDWQAWTIRTRAAALIADRYSGCSCPDVLVVCGRQILPGETLIGDVDFGPQPEVTVGRMSDACVRCGEPT